MFGSKHLFNSRQNIVPLRRDNFLGKLGSRTRTRRKVIFLIFGPFALCLILAFLPWLQIKKIIIIGAESEFESRNITQIIEKQIMGTKYLIVPGSSIIFFNRQTAERDIMNEHRQIDQVSFKFELPSTLAVYVTRQSIAAYFKFAEKIYDLNRSGVIIKQAAQVDSNSVLLTRSANLQEPEVGSSLVSPAQLQVIYKIKEASIRQNLYKILYFDIASVN